MLHTTPQPTFFSHEQVGQTLAAQAPTQVVQPAQGQEDGGGKPGAGPGQQRQTQAASACAAPATGGAEYRAPFCQKARECTPRNPRSP